jgi:hypothetical protein
MAMPIILSSVLPARLERKDQLGRPVLRVPRAQQVLKVPPVPQARKVHRDLQVLPEQQGKRDLPVPQAHKVRKVRPAQPGLQEPQVSPVPKDRKDRKAHKALLDLWQLRLITTFITARRTRPA